MTSRIRREPARVSIGTSSAARHDSATSAGKVRRVWWVSSSVCLRFFRFLALTAWLAAGEPTKGANQAEHSSDKLMTVG